MEEEDELALLDYRTPKGQLIKLLEQKMKKPEIDDSLGKVLDQFTQMTNEQTTFLENGIFQMNFAEDALLLQSCGQYYGKRVDKLWDELLQFHTRMVKYDETTAKNCTDGKKKEARKLELAKLEERLNRGKRKKITLAEPETDSPENGCYILDTDKNAAQELFDRTNLLQGEEEEKEQVMAPFDYNFEIFDDWHEIHRIDEIERKKRGSVVVSQYNRQKYKLKNYIIPNGEEMIYDAKDPEEFNTREGRLISVHHIRHLFEYNDRCLLPDEDFTIAKLRFAYILKKKWLVVNKIDPDAPYETYKAEYEKYQREYFENEKRKIQNMPQRNSEDLMKFYKALEKKEQLARQDQEKLRKLGVKCLPEISFQSLILDPLKEGYKGDYDPYIPLDDDSPPEESVQIPPEGDHEVELSNLFVDLPKLPDSNTETADKLRSDSGYFDGGFEADDESDHEDNTESVPGTDTPFEFDKDNTENKGNDDMAIENVPDKPIENSTIETDAAVESSVQNTQVLELTENEISGNSISPTIESPLVAPNDQTEEAGTNISPVTDTESTNQNHIEEEDPTSIDNESMIREIKEFIKVGTVDEDFNYSILENSYFKKDDDMIMILYNKEGQQDEESIGDDSFDKILDIGESFEKQVANKSRKELLKTTENSANLERKGVKEKEESKKRKLEESNIDDPLPKRRKLSMKQIEKLKRSLIEPVNEPKWESFFSMNYQTESGEGKITRMNYESESEDEDNMPDNLLDNDDDIDNTEEQNGDKIEDVSGYHSDHDGSHLSDHDYCRPESPSLPPTQDSGIGNMDISTNSLNNSTEVLEMDPETTFNKESGLADLSNFDLIAELSKNTGVSCEELAKQQHPEKPELTKYEQQREEARERVAEWKDYIQPKLKNLDEHDFDIHEYGSNIMKEMDVNESKPFGELVAGKSSAEVVRYFISSLQLANTMNVEICGAKKGELSNDSFKLKLLSKERYHEHFQEYQAPSEENLRAKLKKVKQIRMQNKVKQSQNKRKTTNGSSADQSSPQVQPPNKIKRIGKESNAPAADLSNNSQSDVLLTPPPSKKIKILNYNIISSTRQKTVDFQLPSPTSQQNLNFQQPSTSWQADMSERQIDTESVISEITSPIAHTPTRSSIDSGFMPSCDEDFLDQFDQLQQISDTQLRSTPLKPRKVLRVSFARTTNF